MQRDHARLHRSLAVLGPPRRFQLVLLLLSGVDRSVSQLARAVRLSQSCTTRHLQALERAGLVKGTRDGKRVVFRPAPRDATARAVLASLVREAEDAVLLAGLAAGAVPVASTAELDPLTEPSTEPEPMARSPRRPARVRQPNVGDEVHPSATLALSPERAEPFPERMREAAPANDPRAPAESGNRDEDAPPRRYASDIEDFLL